MVALRRTDSAIAFSPIYKVKLRVGVGVRVRVRVRVRVETRLNTHDLHMAPPQHERGLTELRCLVSDPLQ